MPHGDTLALPREENRGPDRSTCPVVTIGGLTSPQFCIARGERAVRRLVACPSLRWCIAVGEFQNRAGASKALVERWNGLRWSIQQMPRQLASLVAVSCSSRTACIAVSGSQAAYWDGRRWSVRRVGNHGELSEVSCWSSVGCLAVGYVLVGSENSQTQRSFAERWDGKRWSVVDVWNPGEESRLDSVACASATACRAVGWYTNSAGLDRPLVERWNGEWFTAERVARPAGAGEGSIAAVSCISASSCRAVGVFTNRAGVARPLMEYWSGRAWSVERVAMPAGAAGLSLVSVSCMARKRCVSVGSFVQGAGMPVPVAERREGTGWSPQYVPNATAAATGALKGVSCSAATTCTAVGYYTNAANEQVTWAERWNGDSWVLQDTPNLTGAAADALGGVSCASDASCVALARLRVAGGPRELRDRIELGPRRHVWRGLGWNHVDAREASGAGGSPERDPAWPVLQIPDGLRGGRQLRKRGFDLRAGGCVEWVELVDPTPPLAP